MHSYTLTISSKGQLILPKKIRTALGSNVIFAKVDGEKQVILSPVISVGGVLATYKKNNQQDFNSVRDKAWTISANRSRNEQE